MAERYAKRARTSYIKTESGLDPVSERKADHNQAKAIKILQKKVKALQSAPEKKTIITAVGTTITGVQAGTDITTTWVVNDLSISSQGSGDSGHTGDEITPTWLEIRGLVEGEDTYNYTRIIVFQAKGSYSDFTAADALPTASGNYVPWMANFTADQLALHYRILADRTIYANANIEDRSDFVIKCKVPHKITYPAAGGTSAEDGFVGIAFVGDSSLTPYPEMFYSAALHYKD